MSYSSDSEAAGLAGDYVGVESCIDLRNAVEFEAYERHCERSYERWRQRRKEEAEEGDRPWRSEGSREKKEFPPPITCLERTENQRSHLPWVMRRYSTTDGRLVIREEKVRHREYFRAHRADGRLTLQLVPLDDVVVEDCCGDIDCCGVDVDRRGVSCTDLVAGDGGGTELKFEVADEAADVEEEEVVDAGNGMKVGVGDGAVMSGSAMVSSVSMSALCVSEGVNGGGFICGGSSGLASASTASGGGPGKKYSHGFNSLRSRSGSSLFDLPVPAIRPVIS
uniref:FAF domain-containing protein n=1 Tax=Kalanchoe fedtschenkoi TaxID=63787 RepID=A0A7N0UNX0_KALFE